MDVRIIESEANFLGLESSWNVLASACGARPFQDFGWAAAWMKTIGAAGGYRPRVATLWQESRLCALMPLAARRFRGVRMLEWIGTKVTDYCDLLVDPKVDVRFAAHLLWSELRRHGGFDILRLTNVRPDAAANRLLDGVRAWTRPTESSWCIPIRWNYGEGWVRSQSASRRAGLRQGLRRMARMGFEFHVWHPPEPYEPLVEAVIEQKCAWLRARNKWDSPLLRADVQDFIRAAAASLAATGALHLSAVRSKERIAACHLGFYRDRTFYLYIPAYHADFSRCGFGTALLDSLVIWACENGASRFDMLLGDEGYKARYHPAPVQIRTNMIGRGIRGKAAISLYRACATGARSTRNGMDPAAGTAATG